MFHIPRKASSERGFWFSFDSEWGFFFNVCRIPLNPTLELDLEASVIVLSPVISRIR